MSNEENCKVISHIAFKVLSSLDINGKTEQDSEKNTEDCKCIYLPKETFNVITNKSDSVNSDCKTVLIYSEKTKGKKKEKKCVENRGNKRVITECDAWKSIDININKQLNLIEDESAINDIVSSELRKKISSYKSQDKRKNIYNNEQFIDLKFVLKLLNDSKLKCYYCNKNVYVIYDNVYESKQWTLERIDNRLGHNKCNSVMSCLDCNLRRRTMYHELYIMTKRLVLVKTLH